MTYTVFTCSFSFTGIALFNKLLTASRETMKTPTLQRTPNGYRAGDAEVTTGPLSPREAQMAALMAQGLSRAQCCEVMGITSNTAAKTAMRLYFKLSVNNMLAAVAAARTQGYLRYYLFALLVCLGSLQAQAARPRMPARTPARITRSVRFSRDAGMRA